MTRTSMSRPEAVAPRSLPIPDTMQSMDIKTNDFDAQKGRDAGAIVDIYTVSGSNNFHGTVNYYFLEQYALRAHRVSILASDVSAKRSGWHNRGTDRQE